MNQKHLTHNILQAFNYGGGLIEGEMSADSYTELPITCEASVDKMETL
jgi:hypothetical protein